MKINCIAKIKDGKIHVYDKSSFHRHLLQFHGDVEITIQNPGRSKQQNKFYWVWMTLLGNTLGYTKDQMHDALKYKFLSYEDLRTGLVLTKSTAELDKFEFNEYLDLVTQFAAENNVVLPDRDMVTT